MRAPGMFAIPFMLVCPQSVVVPVCLCVCLSCWSWVWPPVSSAANSSTAASDQLIPPFSVRLFSPTCGSKIKAQPPLPFASGSYRQFATVTGHNQLPPCFECPVWIFVPTPVRSATSSGPAPWSPCRSLPHHQSSSVKNTS